MHVCQPPPGMTSRCDDTVTLLHVDSNPIVRPTEAPKSRRYLVALPLQACAH